MVKTEKQKTNKTMSQCVRQLGIEANYSFTKVGAAAEWSKALQLREKLNEEQEIPGSPPAWEILQKVLQQTNFTKP